MSQDLRIGRLVADFNRRFGGLPRVYRAPGRINIIGEHTDYSGGYVMPAAIDLFTWVAIRLRRDGVVRGYSTRMEQPCEFQIKGGEVPPGWVRYVKAVILALGQAGCEIPGVDFLIDSDLPIGSGLGSSAALEVALGLAFTSESGCKLGRVPLAQICQKAENEFVGVQCGIMDQMASACGEPGYGIGIDCTDLTIERFAIPRGVRIVVADTMVSHAHGTGEYNRRREELEAGLGALGHHGDLGWVRQLTMDDVNAATLPEILLKRVRHVVSENTRVKRLGIALRNGDLATVGDLMAQSHESLRDDYEVSCPELDAMVTAGQNAPGLLGTRKTGGGFGGCTVSLVDDSKVDVFTNYVAHEYRAVVGLDPIFYVCTAAAGAVPVTVSMD